MGRPKESIETKLNRHIKKVESGCWEWQGKLHQHGYGLLTVEKKERRVHRLAWALYRGEIPEGAILCHTCDNRKCCNPDHLFLGTQLDNMRDAARKGRVKKGVSHHAAKYTPELVRIARARYRAGESMMEIHNSMKLGVQYQATVKVCKGMRWAHVSEGA